MAEIWFSSDLHLWHKNIIEYCNRPFVDAVEMSHRLRDNHNSFVRPQDHWYNLGDVTMERDSQGHGLEILSTFNGHKRLIMGNHDHYHVKHYLKYFEKVMAMQMMDNIRFTHIPIHPSSMGNAKANVHGHIHNNQSEAFKPVLQITKDGAVLVKPYINISVEVTDYRPVTLGEIKEMIEKVKEEVNRHEV